MLTKTIGGAQILLKPGQLLLLMPVLDPGHILPQVNLEGLQLDLADSTGRHPLQTLTEDGQDVGVHLFDAVAQPDAIVAQDLWVRTMLRVHLSRIDSRCT